MFSKLVKASLFRPISNINKVVFRAKNTNNNGVLHLSSNLCSSLIIQPTKYFELLLNHSPTYFVNIDHLKSNFYELQKLVHPDKHAHESGQIIGDMHAFSAEINEAYSTLKDPRKRLEYLCKINGYDYGDKVTVPKEISNKQMQWLISCEDPSELRQSIKEVSEMIEKYEAEIEHNFTQEKQNYAYISQISQILFVLDKSLFHLKHVGIVH